MTDSKKPQIDKTDAADDAGSEVKSGDEQATEAADGAAKTSDTTPAYQLTNEVTSGEPVESAQPAVARRGGFGAMFLGGVLAAVLGFLAAKSEVFAPLLPDSWQPADQSAAVAALEAQIEAQKGELSALRAEIAGIQVPDLAPIEENIAAQNTRFGPLESAFSELGGAIGSLSTRIIELEKRPVSENVSPEAIAAYERELAALQETLKTQRAEVEALIEEARALDSSAAQAARSAAVLATLARLQTAVDAGAPFAATLRELEDAGLAPPEALTDAAQGGVPALSALRTEFPDAARNALADAREAAAEPGLTAFLQRQLGARSVAPREGGSADAVLSRAEAALDKGDLNAALGELAALPEPAQPAFADWIAAATSRQSALSAVESLADSAANR